MELFFIFTENWMLTTHRNLLSQFFGKNFVKPTVLLNKLCTKEMIWRNMFLVRVNFSFYHTVSQCGNNRKFLPLRIYVKLKLANVNVESQNCHLEDLNCHFYELLHFLKFTKLTELRAPKMAILELLVSLKLISRKIWVLEKSWNFHTLKIWFHVKLSIFAFFQLYWRY